MGSNFRTHRIAKTADAWTLKPTAGVLGMVGVLWFFAAFGLLAGSLSVGRVPWWGSLVALVAGAFFFFGGLGLLRRVERPVFDLRRRRFRARAEDPGVAFDTIHAVQLAPHLVDDHNDKERYWSCELNLVHADAGRTRVLSHGNVDALRRDAQEIATLLQVPLWDGTERARDQ